mmetsp:Transcript_8908/g.23122  ORF Transcript_8908/g.23122 Transcript_8908/m.23122 type:complete len:514 (+) Transcript_8908:67-1608(+)
MWRARCLPISGHLALLVGALGADIEHVVLLMMENRPFDFFFGWAGEALQGINCLQGDERNYYDVNDTSKGFETVGRGKAYYVCRQGAGFSFGDWDDAFFGPGVWDGVSRPYPTSAPCSGFLQAGGGNREIMWQMSPEQVPIKTTLAREFAVFDRYFTSFPGPSTPNHLFAQTATSAGCTETGATYHCQKGKTFPQKTIYESLAENNKTWAYFYNDSAWNDFIDFFNTPEGKNGMRGYDEFYARARDGTLPHFSWVLPRQAANLTTGHGPNDDHPCHDIALGERLLKDTYEALRAGLGWNRTLLIVTYDDAGGYYDHVAPPVGVPAPDDEPSCPDKADFTWLGPRAPTLLISPWVSKGRVIHGPSGEPGTSTRPFPNSEFEHSSIPATLKNLFGLPRFLTRRDAWAGSFHEELTEQAPRTDAPLHLPEAPTPSAGSNDLRGDGLCDVHGGSAYCDVLTRRQQRRIRHWEDVHGIQAPSALTPARAEEWIQEQFLRHLSVDTRCNGFPCDEVYIV